jgi:hypothetical protein
MSDIERKIRERAYLLWEEQGRPAAKNLEHWLDAERSLEGQGSGGNEGEGSQTGAREYNRATREFVETGWVDAAAQEAANALDDETEAVDLQEAEEAGKARSHGEDPLLQRR